MTNTITSIAQPGIGMASGSCAGHTRRRIDRLLLSLCLALCRGCRLGRIIVAAPFLFVALQPAYSIAASTTLEPIADAYVRDGTWAGSNFGTSTGLFTKTSNNQNYDSYLRFDLSSVGSIAAARFRISASLSSGSIGMSVYAVSNTTWSETAITWNNKPARGGALGTVTVSGSAFTYYEFDVSSYVIGEKAAGRNLVSLALHNPASSSQSIWMPSRENTSGMPPQLVITLNEAPTVSLTSPANGATFTAPASISLAATAADADGTVTKVDFYAGATLIGTATAAPYSFTWTNVVAGSYSLTARASDNRGAVTASAPVGITVNAPPSVTLTSPANNATFTAPADIPLTAEAADSDGTVSQVEFFQGATLVATDTTAPFTFTLTNVSAGSYTFTARATDNLGASVTSAAVSVTVNTGVAQMYYIHPDHLNAPRVITNQAAQVVWRWDHAEPFGSNVPNENPSGLGSFTCNLRLPGQYFDKETNLHYNYFRDYDPAIGRYIQSDPIGLQGGINTYAYVYDNPLSFGDPKGLDTYVCTRPLRPLGFTVGPIYHQYICTINDLNGEVVCGSIGPSGKSTGSPSRPTGPNDNDVYDPTRCRFVAPPNRCLEDCIAARLRGDLPVYDFRARTPLSTPGAQECQIFTNDVLQSCQQQCGIRLR